MKYTRNVYYIGNLEFARLVPGEAHFYNLDGDEIEKQTTEIKWDAEAAEKGGFEHFMMKEIHEQPKAVQDTLNSVIKNGTIDLSSVEITEDEIKNFEQIYRKSFECEKGTVPSCTKVAERCKAEPAFPQER